jgi:hypothetical protein
MKNAFLAIAILCLPACATNYGSDQIQDFGKFTSLEKDVTTKQIVYEEFGQPHDVTYFQTGESAWDYFRVKMSMNAATFIPFVGLVAGGNDADASIATFFFDEVGKYQKVQTSSKKQYVNQWVGMATVAAKNDEMDRVREEMEKLELPFDQDLARKMKGTSELFK